MVICAMTPTGSGNPVIGTANGLCRLAFSQSGGGTASAGGLGCCARYDLKFRPPGLLAARPLLERFED